jgi:hypothetical protein
VVVTFADQVVKRGRLHGTVPFAQAGKMLVCNQNKTAEVAMIRPFLIALSVLVAAPAHAYLAQNDLRVQGQGDRFEVLASPGMGASRAWCAAGDYAVVMLGLPSTTPLWRISEPPRKAGEGIIFSLSAEGAASDSGLFQFGENDATLTAGAARALCWGEQDFD